MCQKIPYMARSSNQQSQLGVRDCCSKEFPRPHKFSSWSSILSGYVSRLTLIQLVACVVFSNGRKCQDSSVRMSSNLMWRSHFTAMANAFFFVFSIFQFKSVFSWFMLSREFLSCFHHVNTVTVAIIPWFPVPLCIPSLCPLYPTKSLLPPPKNDLHECTYWHFCNLIS